LVASGRTLQAGVRAPASRRRGRATPVPRRTGGPAAPSVLARPPRRARRGAQIAAALKGDASLQSLDIGGNNIGPEGIAAVAEALRGNENLATLELGYNPIGEAGAKALAAVIKYDLKVGQRALPPRPSAACLPCSGCILPHEEAVAGRESGQGVTVLLCNAGPDHARVALRRCAAQGLTTLKMGWCKLGADEGAKAVADLLMFNTTLAALDLRGNGLGDAGAANQTDINQFVTQLRVK
jgi:hypothetical protein